MHAEKWQKGKVYLNNKGEAFEYLDSEIKGKARYHLLRFVATDNYQYVHTAILNNPSRLRDSSKPHVAGVGHSKGTKDRPFAPHMYPHAYEVWCAMINRCYLGGSGVRSYKDVFVAEEWHDFNNFLSWFEAEISDGSSILKNRLALDKDLFGAGKRIYSSDTCCFIPMSINSLLVGLDSSRTSEELLKRVNRLQEQLEVFGHILSPKVKERLLKKIKDLNLKITHN